jgi:ubiquinone/menaquinone biosynthesis C-methylase UbiE
MSLYSDTVNQLVAEGRLDPALPTLVVAGGPTDRQVLLDAGFTDVTISNVDERLVGREFAPYKWRYLDAEELTVEPGEYPQIIEHMGLHHCASPHRGLLEMYRCAGHSMLVFENRDSLAMSLATWLGFVPVFEFEAVAGNGYRYGGYRNTAVPNAVYRWTEREVAKILASYDPAREVAVEYFYALRLPHHRVNMIRNPLKRVAFKAALTPFSLIARLFPRQMNEFGFFIDKRAAELRPWIDPATGTLTRAYWGKEGWKDPDVAGTA